MTKSVHIFILFAECSATLNQWVLFFDCSMILCFQYIYHNMIGHIYGLKSIKYYLLNMNDSPLMITEHLTLYIHWWSKLSSSHRHKLSSSLRHKWQVPTLASCIGPLVYCSWTLSNYLAFQYYDIERTW